MTTVAEDLTPYLDRFGLSQFRPGQEDVIRAVLDRRDCLCIMPTGGGKSLCYQLPAVAREGLTLVVSPLIALMKDQVDQLTAMDVSASFINSSLAVGEQRDRLQRMAAGQYDLLYIAPERLRNEMFIESVRQTQIHLLAVDEAHCVSEWGHDFRPDYARIGRFREQLGNPQTIALTATATPKVRRDVVELLQLKSPEIFVSGFTRPNLQFAVEQTSGGKDKIDRLLSLLQANPGSGIIYAATRKGCEEIVELIARELKRPVGLYHAGLLNDERRNVQERFMRGDVEIIVATNAFGMGINKVNLRFVVHYNMPGSLEAYYQEAGRAGRDGLPARCLLLFSFSDRYIQEFFIDNNYPARETVASVYEYLRSIREYPIELTLQELKDRLDLGVGTEAISASEQILEKAGAIKRLDSQQNRASVWIDSDLPTLVDLLPRESKTRRAVLRAVEQLVGDRRQERVTFRLEKVAAMTTLDRPTVMRALRELTNLNAFDYVPPFRGRAVHVLKPDIPFSKLEIDFQELEQRKRAEYEKLDRMIGYAQTRRCRQAEILDYFGEEGGFRCGACDTCGPLQPLPDSPSIGNDPPVLDDPLLQLFRMALSGVARGSSRFGKQIIAQMLAGSQSSKIQKHRLDQLSTFGLLSFMTQGEIQAVLDELQRQKLIEQAEIDRYRPILQLTPLGREVMRGKVSLPLPVMLPAGLATKVQGTLGPSELGQSAEPRPHSGGEPSAPDPHLLHHLRHWRREKAREADCPTYRIVPSSVLEQLASTPCRTAEDLLGVRGIGPATIVRYGDELLKILGSFWENPARDVSIPNDSDGSQPSEGESDLAPDLAPDPEQADLTRNDLQWQGEGNSNVRESPPVSERSAVQEAPWSGAVSVPEDPQEVEGKDSERGYYWTWRVLAAGFRPRECAAIRRCSLDDVYHEMISAYQHGLDMERSWLFTSDELAELQEFANQSGRQERDLGPPGDFSAAQWMAFQTFGMA